VARVADGLTDRRSPRARAILPAGALLWAWDADPDFDEPAGQQWLILLPSKWNPTTHGRVYSWRFDPRELELRESPAAQHIQRRTRRRAQAYECESDTEDSVL